jgi:hypothetical protein
VPAPRPRKISEFKPLFSRLAQTSHYQVIFGGLSGPLRSYLLRRGVDSRFINESVGLLCNSASLPGSSFSISDGAKELPGSEAELHSSPTDSLINLESTPL